MKKRRCMKITAYFYLPESNDKEVLKYYTKVHCGRIQFYNEYNERLGRMQHFSNISEMGAMVEEAWRKRFEREYREREGGRE